MMTPSEKNKLMKDFKEELQKRNIEIADFVAHYELDIRQLNGQMIYSFGSLKPTKALTAVVEFMKAPFDVLPKYMMGDELYEAKKAYKRFIETFKLTHNFVADKVGLKTFALQRLTREKCDKYKRKDWEDVHKFIQQYDNLSLSPKTVFLQSDNNYLIHHFDTEKNLFFTHRIKQKILECYQQNDKHYIIAEGNIIKRLNWQWRVMRNQELDYAPQKIITERMCVYTIGIGDNGLVRHRRSDLGLCDKIQIRQFDKNEKVNCFFHNQNKLYVGYNTGMVNYFNLDSMEIVNHCRFNGIISDIHENDGYIYVVYQKEECGAMSSFVEVLNNNLTSIDKFTIKDTLLEKIIVQGCKIFAFSRSFMYIIDNENKDDIIKKELFLDLIDVREINGLFYVFTKKDGIFVFNNKLVRVHHVNTPSKIDRVY